MMFAFGPSYLGYAAPYRRSTSFVFGGEHEPMHRGPRAERRAYSFRNRGRKVRTLRTFRSGNKG